MTPKPQPEQQKKTQLTPDDLRDAQRDEHSTWRITCRDLVAIGAVTEADLNSPVRAANTPGQRLLGSIRRWGDKKQILGIAMAAELAAMKDGAR